MVHLMSKYEEAKKRYLVIQDVLAISKLFQRGKTQVPKEVRNALGLKDGDKILWFSQDKRIYVEKHVPIR